MGVDNLRPIKLTHEEATANGRKGGLASAAARKQKKELRALTHDILRQDAIEPYKAVVERLCPALEDTSNLAVVVAAMFKVALYGRGTNAILAATTLVQWAGFMPPEKIQQATQQTAPKEEMQVVIYDDRRK